MKIGIFGLGPVGKALAAGFLKYGHGVKIGSREPNAGKVQEWLAQAGGKATAGTYAEAGQFAEIALLTTPWDGTEDAIQLAGPENLAGKTVLDVTNPLVYKPNQLPTLALGYDDSAGEQIQRWLPDAKVVKAYNIVGNGLFVNPDLPGGPPDMFICGNDAEAKKTTTEINTQFGWNTVDLGGIEMARYIEPLAMVWIVQFIRSGQRDFAFKFLVK